MSLVHLKKISKKIFREKKNPSKKEKWKRWPNEKYKKEHKCAYWKEMLNQATNSGANSMIL